MSILEKIVAQRKLDVAAAKAAVPLSSLLDRLHSAPAVIDFHSRLQQACERSPQTFAVIGEIKRASPSRGDIDATANAAELAPIYAAAGVAAISVLTEPHWFKGSLDDLLAARRAVDHLDHRPAFLRKDFIIDPYQLVEARVYGADTVLLIVASLEQALLMDLLKQSRELGMEPLVEVNGGEEMKRAVEAGAKVIGINNRNLHTFTVDLFTAAQAVDKQYVQGIASDAILVALSGIAGPKDVVPYLETPLRALLVGEALMRAPDKAAFVSALTEVQKPSL